MAEYIERTEELVLAMNAGASACEHTWRHHSAVYTKNFLSDNSQEISYLMAAKVLLKVSDAPAADVAPVQHGRWERIGIKGRKGLPIYPCCSACGMVSAAYRSEWEGLRGAWKYCPNCGAKMDLEDENHVGR